MRVIDAKTREEAMTLFQGDPFFKDGLRINVRVQHRTRRVWKNREGEPKVKRAAGRYLLTLMDIIGVLIGGITTICLRFLEITYQEGMAVNLTSPKLPVATSVAPKVGALVKSIVTSRF